MHKILFHRSPLKDTKSSAVPEPGAQPKGSIPARAGRVAGHPPDVEPLNRDAWKAEHRQPSLLRSPRATLGAVKGFFHKGKPGARTAAAAGAVPSDRVDEAELERPDSATDKPRPSRRADLAFSSATSMASAAPKAAGLLARGGLITINGGRDFSTPAPNPLAADAPELTMPGAMPLEPPSESPPGPDVRPSIGHRLLDGAPRAARRVTEAPGRAGAAVHDEIAVRAFKATVDAGAAGGALFVRGGAQAAIGAMTSRLPSLPAPSQPLPAVPRGDTLMPGTFPGTEAAVNADLRQGLLDPVRAAASQARAKARDAAAQAAFEGGVAGGRLLLQGAMQALDRRFPALPAVVPTDRLPGTFPQEAAVAAPTRPDPLPVPLPVPSTPPPAYAAHAHERLPAYDEVANDLPPGYDMPTDAAPKPSHDPAPRMPGSWVD